MLDDVSRGRGRLVVPAPDPVFIRFLFQQATAASRQLFLRSVFSPQAHFKAAQSCRSVTVVDGCVYEYFSTGFAFGKHTLLRYDVLFHLRPPSGVDPLGRGHFLKLTATGVTTRNLRS